MATLVDTNVLIDLFGAGSEWTQWSVEQIAYARDAGPTVINQIIYAEMAAGFEREAVLDMVLSPKHFQREDLPWQAAFHAGQAFLKYRQSGGHKSAPLPDFYIGAHALVNGHRLLTRDLRRYRPYFPSLELITPESHP